MGPDTARMSRAISPLAAERQIPQALGPGVAVILLNWNGWKDTIECLESVLRMSYRPSLVIVCDNASTDGSLDQIRAWAEGSLAPTCANPYLTHLVMPPIPKPVQLVMIDSSDAWSSSVPEPPFVLIQTGANLGFAGGNNVGLRYALSRQEIQYFWILNNDTVVEPGALSALVSAIQADHRLGLCGSVLRDYSCPGEVLTLGGRRYSRLSGRTRPVQVGAPSPRQPGRGGPDYIEGASMLVRRDFLETVGLMAEDYFLYFEEMDWVMRARGRFNFTYAPESIVYHKEGCSIGSHKDRNRRSALSDFFQARNRLTFTRRYFPWLLPAMLVGVIGTAVHRLITGRRKNAEAVVKGIFAALNSGAASGGLI